MSVLKAFGLALFSFVVSIGSVYAQTILPVDKDTTGYVDLADNRNIAGWATDPDSNDPVAVLIYVDGKLVKSLAADQHRADVGRHAFHWEHQGFGPGRHKVSVYAIGILRDNSLSGAHAQLKSKRPLVFSGDLEVVEIIDPPPSEPVPESVVFTSHRKPAAMREPKLILNTQ